MTLKTNFPSHIFQILDSIAESINSLFEKLEVLLNSNLIVNSIRILIIVLALLMGYIHTRSEKNKLSSAKESTLIDSTIKPIIENVK